MPRYSNDPRWINARYAAQCATCKETIARGAGAYYYPATRTLLCSKCGSDAAREFAAAAFDESMYQ